MLPAMFKLLSSKGKTRSHTISLFFLFLFYFPLFSWASFELSDTSSDTFIESNVNLEELMPNRNGENVTEILQFGDPCTCSSDFIRRVGFRDTIIIVLAPGATAILEVSNGNFLREDGSPFTVGRVFQDGGALDDDGIVNGEIFLPFIRAELSVMNVIFNGVRFQSDSPCPRISACPNFSGFVTCPQDEIIACADEAIPIPSLVKIDTLCLNPPNDEFSSQAQNKSKTENEHTIDITGPVVLGPENCDGTTYTFQFVVTDLCSNTDTCFQTFTIQNNPPIIVCPPNLSVDCPENFVPGMPEIETACDLDSSLMITIGDLPDPPCTGDQFGVIYEVTDVCGRASFCEQIVTISNEPSLTMISCPSDSIITCDTGILLGDIQFTSTCGVGTVTTISDPVILGELNCPGTTYTYTYTVTDICGNSESCDQTFTIVNDSPTITCPQDISVVCPDDFNPGTPTFETACELGSNLFITIGEFPDPPCSTTQFGVIYEVTDDCGRASFCEQIVTISDVPTLTMISCPSDSIVTCDSAILLGEIQFISTCGVETAVTISDPVILGELNCPGTTYTYTYTVTDVCGNFESCDQTFTIVNDSPTITCPQDVSIVCLDDFNPGTPTFETACELGSNLFITVGDLPNPPCAGDQFGVIYEVTDDCGRASFCEQIVTISDSLNLIILCGTDEVVSCESEIRPTKPSFESVCGIDATVSKTALVVSGEPGQNGTTYTYTFTVTDDCGRTASCDQVFTIENKCTNIDFDGLSPGTIVTDQFTGVTVTTHNPQHNPAMIFDTGNPTGNDFDIGTPNSLYGGPGQGIGFCNAEFQGNALIVTKDLNIPNETEGEIIFNFDCAVFLRSIDFLDMECDHNTVSLFDRDGDLIETFTLPQFGENSFHTEIFNIGGVFTVVVSFPCAGGAITDVVYCEDKSPGATCGICSEAILDFNDDGVEWNDDNLSYAFTNGYQQFDITISDPDQIFEGSSEADSGIQVEMEPLDLNDALEIKYTLSEVSSFVVFDIVDLDFKDHGSKQQEMVCICGINTTAGPELIYPTIYSLDGSVEIDGNCAIATTDSASSGQDESILVKFTECVDEITIKYGAGPDSPINDPDFSKIQIGKDFGFYTSKCPNDCAPCELIGDVDKDGVCDDCDICLNGDDALDSDGDGIPDSCDSDCDNTLNEGDDDMDGVCNLDDVCPGGNDQIDEDGNGVPDDCEECIDYTLAFGCTNEWLADSLSGSYTVQEQIFDIVIMNMDSIFVDSNQEGCGLNVGIDPTDVDDIVTIKYALSEVANNVMFDIVDLDYKGNKQQEGVCIYGFLDTVSTPILPVITSLNGSVAITDNCAEGTVNSNQSGQDESIMVVFEECIDMIVIEYGSGSNPPVQDPDYSNITIGLDLGFKTQVCEHLCLPECPEFQELTGNQFEFRHVQASSRIRSSQVIQAPEVIYSAGNEVDMHAGFRVMNGSIFEVMLNGCENQ
jgi:hypothetical protein